MHLPQIDGTDARDLTAGEIEGRRQAIYGGRGAAPFHAGMRRGKTAQLRHDARHSRYAQDRRAVQHDRRGRARNRGDSRTAIGIFPEFVDGYGILLLPTTGRYFHVPYRSLVPKGVAGLIVAGRCIGGDKISHAATRNMMCCAVSGQGAGVAAAVSLQTGESFERLDVGRVQKELRRQGARIG